MVGLSAAGLRRLKGRGGPGAFLCQTAFQRAQPQEVLYQAESVFGQKAFRMKLYAVKRKPSMGQPHDRRICGVRGNHEVSLEGLLRQLHRQRVIPGGLQRGGYLRKKGSLLVFILLIVSRS